MMAVSAIDRVGRMICRSPVSRSHGVMIRIIRTFGAPAVALVRVIVPGFESL